MGAHLIDGEFQSDKYPTTPRGKVPLSVNDPMAQDLLWEYAQRRRGVDAEFSDDLETALKSKGFIRGKHWEEAVYARVRATMRVRGDFDSTPLLSAEVHRAVELAREQFKRSGEKERFFHRHRMVEFYYDLRADEPGGPRTYHGIAWACRCGRITNGGSGP